MGDVVEDGTGDDTGGGAEGDIGGGARDVPQESTT